MFKCYDTSKLQNEILKCDECKVSFNSYDQPRILPCGETICSTCLLKIEKRAMNKRFKCSLCLADHYIPDNGFAINKKMYALITSEPMEISRGYEYDRLQENLNKVLSISKLLFSDCENGHDIISEYCNEQIRLIQLSTENKIEQINKLSDELIAFIREYERKCVESYLNNKKLIKVEIDKILNEANIFINEKQAYLQQYKIDDKEIKKFNKRSEELQTILSKKSKKLKYSIFDNNLIRFISNAQKIDKFEIGNFDYGHLNEPLVILFFIFF